VSLQNPRTIARVFGWLFVATFATSIPAYSSLFTGRYPRGMFDFVQAVMRWGARVGACAFVVVIDPYPPSSLAA